MTAVPMQRRLVAILALVAYAAAIVVLIVSLADDVLALILAWVAVIVAAGAIFAVLTRRGVGRVVATVVAIGAAASVVGVLIAARAVIELIVFGGLVVAGALLSRYAVAADAAAMRHAKPPGTRVDLPRHPVLLMNPKSGGGKVEKFRLVEQCRRRNIEPVVLGPGDDLAALARDAVARGADVLGMAGGDGSQALVASIAIEHDLPFVCIPAGTRNHLALDLGVDRDDVVGALDAFGHGYERRVDLGRVGGRIFVNNVSLGVYARVVQSDAYRDDKVGTVTKMLPEMLGPNAPPFDLSFDEPDGSSDGQADLMLVSNNPYRLDRIGGFGSRVAMDTGRLGVVVLKVRSGAEVAQLVACQSAGQISRFAGWREWDATELEVRSHEPIEAGVDGEALRFDSPLRFEILPAALRVRVAPHHPGYSPAAIAASVQRRGIRRLFAVAAGRDGGGPSAPAAHAPTD
jgi:diacylglycerol kinase family enzyme